MAWHAVYETATGRLHTMAQLVENLPGTYTDLPIVDAEADAYRRGERLWNQSTRTFDVRPPAPVVDRLQDLTDDPVLAAVWSRLTAAQRTTLRNRLITLLGRHRYRTPSAVAATIDEG